MYERARSRPRIPGARAPLAPGPALWAGVLAAALSACGAPAAGSSAPAAAAGQPGAALAPVSGPAAAELSARADAADAALLDRFWDAGAGDFAAAWPSGGEPAGYWVSAIALDALLDAAGRGAGDRALEAVRAFVAAQDRRGWSREWFDDEAWMAVALLRAQDATGDPSLRDRAAALVDDIARNAPDQSCCGATPGGLWWDRSHTQKATAANAVPVIAAAALFERTGEGRWLDFARATYASWRSLMVDAASGQVADHLLPSGERVWWRFSYDGGAMIGAALALHRATGETAYLDDARGYAAFLLSAQTRPTAFGPVLFDGASCAGDCDAFKGIAHRYLDALASAAPDVPGLGALLAADGAAAWSLARDPATGTFGVDWGAPAGPGATLAAQASATTALGLAAARAAGRVAAAP